MFLKKQRGMTLLEIMLVMVIAGSMAVSRFQEKLLEFEHTGAKQLGVEIFQYNNAVRRFLASYKPDPAEVAGGSVHTAVFEGVDWLKSTDCGTAPNPSTFLNCDFNETTNMGRLKYITEVTVKEESTPGNPARLVKSAKTILYSDMTDPDGKPLHGVPLKGSSREDLAGVAALVASGGTMAANVSNPGDVAAGVTSDGYVLHCTYFEDPTMVRTECNDKILSPADGEIDANGHLTMFVSNNTVNDIWIRQDGGNQMKAHFDFDSDPVQKLAVRNVSAIVPKAGELILTDKTDLTPGAVKIHGNLTFLDDIVASKNVNIGDGIANSAQLNVSSKSNFTGDAAFDGNTRLNGTTTINGQTTLNGRTFVNGESIFDANAHFKKSARFDQKAVFWKGIDVHEDATYNGNMTVKGILKAEGAAPYSVESTNGIKVGTKVVAPVFTDQDMETPKYYVSPSAESYVKNLTVEEAISSNESMAGTYRFIDPTKDEAHWGLNSDTNLIRYSGKSDDAGTDTQLSLRDGLIHNIGVVPNGAIVQKPDCPDMTPAIYTSLAQVTSKSGNPLNPYAIQTYAESTVDGGKQVWRVKLRYYGPDKDSNLGWQEPDGDYARIQIITKCVL